MENTVLASLPKEWQSWILDNLARGCEPSAMGEIMVRDGHFDNRLAHAAIEEARNSSRASVAVRQPMPEIDTSVNTIQALDRSVQVLFTMKTPRIVLLGNVVSDEECDALCAYAQSRLARSPVVGDDDGSTKVHAERTSRGAMLARGETELIARIDARLGALARWPVDHAEGLQVVHYEKGNEYRPHFDWFDPSLPGPRKHLEQGGQRVGTFVVYLSDVEQGGGTAFPGLGLEVQPRKGNAVFFANTTPFGEPDKQTLHAGSPVVRGVKYIANKWLRQNTY